MYLCIDVVVAGLFFLQWGCCSVNAGYADTWDYCECVWLSWLPWSDCTEECYGVMVREREVWITQHDGCDAFDDCATADLGYTYSDCNENCFNGGTYSNTRDECLCVPGRYGRCCKLLVTCGDPGDISNGQMSGSNFIFQSSVAYTCNQDHNMTAGTSSRVCQENGMWSGAKPTCVFVKTCRSNPCQNGATCIDGLNEYRCICLPGWSGKNCDEDIQPPVVSNCSDYMAIATDKPVTTVVWEVPDFNDPMGHDITIAKNYDQSQYEFPWGDFSISYVATKSFNGLKTECIFTIGIRPNQCDVLNIPVNGARVCNGWMSDYGQYCLLYCSNNFTLSQNHDYRQWYVCGASGHWSAPTPVPDCAVPVYDFMTSSSDLSTSQDLTFGSCGTDLEDIKTRYIKEIRSSAFSTFCTNHDDLCTTENVIVSC